MNKDHDHSCHIDLTFREHVADRLSDTLFVDRAWLPMFVWENVPIRTKSSRGLTMMERFVIECLIRLNDCHADDLREIAAIPTELADWLLASCLQKGLATRKGDRFQAETHACDNALQQNRIPIVIDEQVDLLCFPETEEFALIRDAGQFIRDVRSVLPSGQFPLPERWKRAERREMLSQAIKSGRVYGEGVAAIVDVHGDARVEQDTCPAYQANAILVDQSEGDWRLEIIGSRKIKRRASAESTDGQTDAPQVVSIPIDIPALPHLVRNWRDSLAAVQGAIRDRLSERGLATQGNHNGCWQVNVDGAAASAMACEQLLATSIDLEVLVDREVRFSFPLQLQPSDRKATKAFDRDAAVREVLSSPQTADAAASICNAARATMAELRHRLWELKEFGKVYELREAEDFGE